MDRCLGPLRNNFFSDQFLPAGVLKEMKLSFTEPPKTWRSRMVTSTGFSRDQKTQEFFFWVGKSSRKSTIFIAFSKKKRASHMFFSCWGWGGRGLRTRPTCYGWPGPRRRGGPRAVLSGAWKLITCRQGGRGAAKAVVRFSHGRFFCQCLFLVPFKRWDRWHSPSPNWQEKCHLYWILFHCFRCPLFSVEFGVCIWANYSNLSQGRPKLVGFVGGIGSNMPETPRMPANEGFSRMYPKNWVVI